MVATHTCRSGLAPENGIPGALPTPYGHTAAARRRLSNGARRTLASSHQRAMPTVAGLDHAPLAVAFESEPGAALGAVRRTAVLHQLGPCCGVVHLCRNV